MQIRKYVIRHIPTGYFIPVPYYNNTYSPTGNNRGGSHYEPIDKPHLIRLFVSEISAKRFLTSWLMGKHVGAHEDGYSYVDRIKPVASRIRSEMEIILAHVEIPE